MPAVAVIGMQWGDEGKGKLVDIFSEHADVVVRFQGGNNAGHTVVVNDQKTVLHLVPSGVLHPGKVCVIGNGVVVDPTILVEEIERLQARGFLQDESLLKISDRAHLILPYHRAIDLARERLRGAGRIGTTGRGIGPTYEDKMARIGIRFAELLDDRVFPDLLRRTVEEKNIYLRAILNEGVLHYEEIRAECERIRERLAHMVTDTSAYLDRALAAGRRVLFEGGQGTMLDVDHGTYPYVTSSNTVAGGVCTGGGIAPNRLTGVIGITKAYTTRVGGGPFPTELTDEVGQKLQQDGAEYGATTGRPRRCGWFDAVVARRAVRLNGLTGMAITKLDVLTGLKTLRLCVAYRCEGQRIDEFPANQWMLEHMEPIYEELPGWEEPIGRARTMEDLPENARRYVRCLEELTGTRVTTVSVGARREDTITLSNPFTL